MNVFLLFAFNAELLREHLREKWMEVFDFTYIDDKIIGMVEKNLPSVQEIIRYVEKRATGKNLNALTSASNSALSVKQGDDVTSATSFGKSTVS